MATNKQFEAFIKAGKPLGEVIGVDKFLVTMKGLQPVSMRSLILFDDGSSGFVHQIFDDHVSILHMGQTPLILGSVGVVQSTDLVVNVGEGLIGRVVSVTGEPLDNRGPIASEANWPVFAPAPAPV